MVTILMQIVEHLGKISMFLKDLNLFRVCIISSLRCVYLTEDLPHHHENSFVKDGTRIDIHWGKSQRQKNCHDRLAKIILGRVIFEG